MASHLILQEIICKHKNRYLLLFLNDFDKLITYMLHNNLDLILIKFSIIIFATTKHIYTQYYTIFLEDWMITNILINNFKILD